MTMNGLHRYSTNVEVTCQRGYNGYTMQNKVLLPEPDQADELFITFANTLEYEHGQPVDALPDLSSLLAWLREQRLISGRGLAAEAARLRRDADESARRVERFRHLRGVLHAVAEEVTQ